MVRSQTMDSGDILGGLLSGGTLALGLRARRTNWFSVEGL